MKFRIAMWAGVGFLVAGWWALYFFATQPQPIGSSDPIMTLVDVTCPVALLRSYPISLYLVLLANTATYALIGLTVESLWHKLGQAH